MSHSIVELSNVGVVWNSHWECSPGIQRSWINSIISVHTGRRSNEFIDLAVFYRSFIQQKAQFRSHRLLILRLHQVYSYFIVLSFLKRCSLSYSRRDRKRVKPESKRNYCGFERNGIPCQRDSSRFMSSNWRKLKSSPNRMRLSRFHVSLSWFYFWIRPNWFTLCRPYWNVMWLNSLALNPNE